jgi:hypothetical protein
MKVKKISNFMKTILFLHIPKTAGTTFQSIINNNYLQGYHRAYSVSKIEKINKMPPSKKKMIRILAGHFGYGIHEVFPQRCEYITFLREPLARELSGFYYMKSHKNHRWHNCIKNMDFKTYVYELLSQPFWQNRQTALLSGALSPGLKDYDGELTRDDFKKAKSNLDNMFSVIGLTEEFDKSLFLLQKRYDWSHITYNIKNKGNYAEPLSFIDTETSKQLKDNSRLDIELYEYAKKIFYKQYK